LAFYIIDSIKEFTLLFFYGSKCQIGPKLSDFEVTRPHAGRHTTLMTPLKE